MKVALDVDGILSNFNQRFIETAKDMGLGDHFPARWQWIKTWRYSDRFSEVWDTIKMDTQWWLSIEPHAGARESIKFPVEAYVTARPIPGEFTAAWLQHYEFPLASVLTVEPDASKLAALKHLNIDLYVDDRPENFHEVLAGGITCLLFDRPWNRECADGGLRITSLEQVTQYLKKEEAK
jgi:hypothetical protein